MEILKEDNYKEDIADIRVYLDKKVVSGHFKGEKNVDIYYEYYINDKRNKKNKSVVISHGFCENIIKYTELIYYLYEEGYSVYALEHRGMSRSTHLGKDYSMVHVEKFDYYIQDMKTYIEDIVKKNEPDNDLYLFSHSQGGLIGTRYIQTYTKDFKKAVLLSPFYRYKKKCPIFIAKLLLVMMGKIGFRKHFAPTQHKYKEFMSFEKSHTSSRARYEFNKKIHDDLKSVRMIGGSCGWLYECLKAQDKVFKLKNFSQISAKMFLVSCNKDEMVDIKYHDKFFNKVNNCVMFKIEESKHEPFFESNVILEKCIKKVLEFLEA